MAINLNKQREKEILAFVKAGSKKRNWNYRGWQIFKIAEPFIVSVSFSVYGKENCINCDLEFKPTDIDNLKMEITGQDDYFKDGPLYYKVNSAGMVFPYKYSKHGLCEITEQKINILLSEIDENVTELVREFSDTERHYEFVKEIRETQSEFAENQYLITLVYLKKYDDLLARLKDKTDSGMADINLNNTSSNRKSFHDMIADYVNKQDKN